MSPFDFMKNIFFFLLFIQILPLLLKNIEKQYSTYLSPRTKVGVLSFSGAIYDSSYHNKQLNEFFKNPEIKAILLVIDCPGTAAPAGQAIQNELLELKKQYHKTVVVLIKNICASGGYYIASAADYIVAPGASLIGSIGVTLPYFFKVNKLMEQWNINYVTLKAGKYKTATDPFTEITPEEIQQLQLVLDDTYHQFVADVARNRNLAPSTMNTWAEGQLFSGQQALKMGLIDLLGSEFNAIKALKEKAIIEGDIEWVKPPRKKTFLSMFGASDDENHSDDTVFTSVFNCVSTACHSFLNNVTVPHSSQIT